MANGALDPTLEGLDAVKQFNERPQEPQSATSSAAPRSALKGRKEPKARPSATPLPPTKEDQARKRAFADLVDLSLLSDDEEPAPVAVQSPAGLPNGATSTTQTQPTSTTPANVDASAPAAKPAQAASTTPVAVHAVPPRPSTSSQPAPGISGQVPASASIVPPADQLGNVRNQSLYLDLPLSHPARQNALVQPLDRHKAKRVTSYNPKTIARDVLLASGRHPDMRHLNVHMEILRQHLPAFTNNNIDLETIRWDIIDPGGPEVGSATASARPSAVDEANMADDEGDSDEDSVLGNATPAFNATNGTDVGTTAAMRIRQHTFASGKPVGRPRRYNPEGSAPFSQSPAQRNSYLPKKAPEPAKVPLEGSPAGQGYAALNQFNADGTKKKGRPVGWRKWMQKSPGQTTPSGGGGGTGAPRGRPPGSSSMAKEEAKRPPSPKFQVFKCQWQGCDAELHNLVTLRKHLHKKHGVPNAYGVYKCLWSGCGQVKAVKDGPRTVSRFEIYEFTTLDPWKEHVEKNHLNEIAWKLGDGRPGGLSGGEGSDHSDAYLSDSQGRRVTPVVRMPTVEERTAAAEQNAAGSSGAAKGKRSAAEEAARKEEEEVLARRRRLGPGVDREGSNIVTPKRAQGFIDDDVEMGEGELMTGSDDEAT